MQQHIQPTQLTLKAVAHENSCTAGSISAQMVQLEVVKGAVANLLERIDDIVHKGCIKTVGWLICLF